MEAKALLDFNGTNDNELSFKRGSTLKILDDTSDNHWCKAEQHGREGMIPKNYVTLYPSSWFNGSISRNEAEELLRQQKRDGAFLIRKSESTPGDFRLSVKWDDGVEHFTILRDGAGKYFLWLTKFNSLNELVEYHYTSSVSRSKTIFLRADGLQELKSVRALYDLEAEADGDLSFKRGDIIHVIDDSDESWWKGKCNGKVGMLPSTYVTPCYK